MLQEKPGLMQAVRDRFAQIDSCPVQGPRIFFENAGGALTLKSVVETSTSFAAIPDNQGRANPGSQALVDTINTAKADMMMFLNAPNGQVFVGESGSGIIETPAGDVLGSSLEHPASRSAAQRWAKVAGKPYINVEHDAARGSVSAEAYAAKVTPETRVATILHTSPVSGMGVDVGAVAKAIRAVSPDCYIVVDGIQHAAHGHIDIAAYDIDAYVISPYKMFSRHGYGLAWISDRFQRLPHDALIGGPELNWELGTRDTGSYATLSDVVAYMEWLGSNFTDSQDRRTKVEAAGAAIHAHEKALTDAMLYGMDNLKGLADLPGVTIVGGADNPLREGLVSFALDGWASADLVEALNVQGIRTHTRKADHYSANILEPLGMETCVRVSLCHYNNRDEVARFLSVMQELSGA